MKSTTIDKMILMLGAACCCVPLLTVQGADLAVITKGRMKAATAVSGKWKASDQSIVSTGTHYLFANQGLGPGDFKVRVRLSLEAFNRSAAAFVLDNNKFGFEGSHGRMFVQGPKFANGLTIAEPKDFITQGRPFELLVTRVGKTLTFLIDNKQVWKTEYDVKEIKSIGVRPWRATMRLYDFSIEGNLITASLPKLTAVSRNLSWDSSLAERRRMQAAAGTPGFARELLAATPRQMQLLALAKKDGLLTLAPVHLPNNPKGDNDHYGWPVATMIGNTIVVVHRSMPGHNPRVSGPADANTTYSTILRSTDNGKTWSEPYDIRDCMTPEDRNRGGSVPLGHRYKFAPDNRSPLGYKLHLNAIGTTHDGAVILASNHGVFRSEDQGKSWRHLRMAFREDQHEGHFAFVGPRIIDHPKHGLLLFAHHTIYRFRRPVDIAHELAVYRSRDRAASWERTTLKLPAWCKPAEPDVILHDARLVAIVRTQAPANQLSQMRFDIGDREISEVANTPMKTQVSVDTSAICFNPVTQRYEVVQSKREDMSIHLYSLAPKDWKTANWRHEGRLFKRKSGFYNFADGFHTGGAVIDHEKKVQHIFFYSGHPGGPAGVFRLTRTLDTPKLANFLKSQSRPDQGESVKWTGDGSSDRWSDPANWNPRVPGKADVAIFENTNYGRAITIEGTANVGRLELKLSQPEHRLTFSGKGTLVCSGAEGISNKYSTALIQTGVLDLGADLNVEIRNQRFIAGNKDGTLVIRSNRIRAGQKEASSQGYKSDGQNLKLGITDRGRILLLTPHWNPGMSLDMSASGSKGIKIFDFGLKEGTQGLPFLRLKEHDGDPVEIRGFDEDDFFRFRADPFKSCDPGKLFRLDAVKFVGWPENGKANVEKHGEYWYLKPARASLPSLR